MKEKLLKRLPKKYHARVKAFDAECGLIDDCKYMLYFVDGWQLVDMETVPCRSVTEAVEFVKDSTLAKEE